MISITKYTSVRQTETYQLSVKPEQAAFTASDLKSVIESLQSYEDGHLILHHDTVVGFFLLDTEYSKHYQFNDQNAIGVRSLLIDHRYQGHGFGRLAMAALPDYVREHYSAFNAIQLTVNCRNSTAYTCYLKANFKALEERYYGGPVGPQYVMQYDL